MVKAAASPIADGRLQLDTARMQSDPGQPPFHRWTLPDGSVWAEFYRLKERYVVRFPGLADFEVARDGLNVVCWPVPDVSDHAVEHLYLNQVWPLVLGQQGGLVFHASAVDIDGTAVAFLGSSGRGKSTLAASFSVAGCPFLTDDGLVLERSPDGRFIVLPGHPSVRLWGDSERALMAGRGARAPALHYTSKARILADDLLRFCAGPRPLGSAYFLESEPSRDIRVERIGGADAVVEWVRHAFLLDIEERDRLRTHFGQLGQLADQLPQFRLSYPRTYEGLERVRSFLAEHVRDAAGTT